MTSTISSNKAAVKWALIYVVISIILTYTYQFLNIDQGSSIKYITYIPYIAFMLLAQKEYKDQLGGYMSFGEGFMTGFKYTVITAILGCLFAYIYWTLLSPQMFQQLVDQAKEQSATKNLTDEQMAMQARFLTPGFFTIIALIASLVSGTIIALIGAAIFKKDKPLFLNDESVPYSDPAV